MSKEVIELIEKQGLAWEEFKKTNDQRLADLEKSRGTADYEAKLSAINADITKLSEQMKEIATKQARPGNPGAGDVTDAGYTKGFGAFVRKGDITGIEGKAINVGTDSDGGYAVPEELDRSILMLLRKATPMRAVAGQITVGTPDYKKLVSLGGAGSGWVGETDARAETNTPTLAQISPFMGEIYAEPRATQQSLDDVFFNVEQWLSDEVAMEFAEKENAAFVSGDGTKKPKGILAYPNAATADGVRAFGTLQFVNSGAAAAITPDGLVDLIYSLRRGHRLNASCMFNGMTHAAIRKLKDSDGNYLWAPGLQAGEPDRLLGYGIVENDDMPDVAANALPIAFGDFRRGYLIVDRIGTRILRDPYTAKPFVKFYTTKRVGGMLQDSEAIKLQKIAA
jgi:HK97 family phage major capsid protein